MGGYLPASTSGSHTAPKPSARSCRCRARAWARCCCSGAIRFSESHDHALAETINRLYRAAELIDFRGPWKTRESVVIAPLHGVSWFNHHRLMEGLSYIPPAEAEASYYSQLAG